MVWGSPLKPCTDQTPTETLQSLGLQNRGLQQGTQNIMSASAVVATAVSLCFLKSLRTNIPSLWTRASGSPRLWPLLLFMLLSLTRQSVLLV